MSTTEIVILVVSAISLIASMITLYLSSEWKVYTENRYSETWTLFMLTKTRCENMETKISNLEDDIFELKKTIADAGLETMNVCIDDHDKNIKSLRRDLLDLQVITGVLPSKAGTMLQEVENTKEALDSVRSAYKEQQAVVERMKEQMASLSDAYNSLHFTGAEMDQIRQELANLKNGAA